MLFCCTKLSVKLLSELCYQVTISVQWYAIKLPNVAFSKAILSHENCMSHSMSILSGKYTYPFFDTFVKNEFCNRIINSMDWLSFVVSSVSLSLSHWYPGSGVVLDCIDS